MQSASKASRLTLRIRNEIYWWLVMQHFDSSMLGDLLPMILPRRFTRWLAKGDQ